MSDRDRKICEKCLKVRLTTCFAWHADHLTRINGRYIQDNVCRDCRRKHRAWHRARPFGPTARARAELRRWKRQM